MRLNKYISHCGVTSRRKAGDLVKAGKVYVNGSIEKNPSYMVQEGDEVKYNGKTLALEENKVYILMNKPKNTVTTLSDENGRMTVRNIIGDKVRERIYPVGRLDRMTTGLLLLTNDGDLATRLAHPSGEVKKFYRAVLDKAISQEDLLKIRNGLTLEDGFIKVDGVDMVKDTDGMQVGIELHSGRNRIIRRIFEHLGYTVVRLDREYYAGLTKKDLKRGWWRHLTDREVVMLKHFV
ncbi:pseudouridine synthase [Portibacter marinus]|uniref:pseudouridine synthase n=1 Tax=Portibacter marinus TaxID=2898660 RepID=UPI001F3B3606|nr:pseudouridine synthase [Portibacter marinus]